MEVQNTAPRQVRHPVARIEKLLSDAEISTLFDGVMAREQDFVVATTTDQRPDVRRSLILNPPSALVAPVVDRVRSLMPKVLPMLRMPVVPVGEIEAQVTANNDGAFFSVHTDADYDKADRRYLTYVYYFNSMPKGFSGGELRLYDDILRNNKLAKGDTFQVIEPTHNTLVLFWARVMHEVRPVSVPSKQFRDSRLTVNGWVNKATATSAR
jgi:Rps23 Pro-64 3,4-dihydroxylase Tpa1-like proline 4-hydroxylase